MIPILIKFLLIAALLGGGALFVMRSMGAANVLGGLASKTTTTRPFQERLGIVDTVAKVLPAFTEAPSLAPLINTKNNIQRSIESVIDLPQQERAAFCKQVCSP